MKVLLVHNEYQIPGGEEVVVEQERQLLERAGHQVVSYRRSNWETDAYTGVRRLALAKRVAWASDSRREMARLLQDEKPQVVHVHNTFMMISPSIYSACQEAQVPVVQTLHNYRLFCPAANFYRDGRVCEECVERSLWRGIRYGCYRESQTATLTVALMLAFNRARHSWTQGVNIFVALTEFARQRFIRGGLPAEKVSVKPNFVSPDPGERPATDGHYALFVGRLSAEKGLRTLLSAWKRLTTPIRLVIIGDGPLLDPLRSQVAEQGLGGVSFRGRVPREETWSAAKEARFLILPSECYENFPMSIAEAFAIGTPVICSRLGAMQEVVEEGCTGLQFTPGDPDDLARKVEWAWAHREQMREMGRQARAAYEARYTPEKNYQLLMQIYERAMVA